MPVWQPVLDTITTHPNDTTKLRNNNNDIFKIKKQKE